MNNVYNDVQMTKEVPRTSVLRDEELNKTLIARLRSVWRYKDLHLCPEAADRIEALIVTAALVRGQREKLTVALAETEAKLAENEVRLGKAVEALGRIARQPDYRLPSPQEIARATLEELKGENHE